VNITPVTLFSTPVVYRAFVTGISSVVNVNFFDTSVGGGDIDADFHIVVVDDR